jgi:predicted RNA-binding Zn ribbon-like protein
MAAHTFELVGGHPVLDFLNTIHDWTVETPRDYLAEPAEAVRFGSAAGLLSPAEARRLAARIGPRELGRLRTLRARLAGICRALVAGGSPRPADLHFLSAARVAVARHSRTRHSAGRLVPELITERAGSATLRLKLADAAVALLASDRIERLKSCPTCGWFFLDTSKNGSRRWCSMATCGASEKARRYYWKDRSRRA